LGPACPARGILVKDEGSNSKGAHMKLIAAITVLGAALAATLIPAAGAAPTAPPTAAQLRQFEGTVVSVNSGARTFRLRDAERGTARIKVTGRTRFERLAGFSALRPGLRRIEARVQRRNGVWVAFEVERSGGGGEHGGRGDDRGGDGNRGGDDRGGNDDRAGDDRGRDDDRRGGDDH
jgi:hypothetical protein